MLRLDQFLNATRINPDTRVQTRKCQSTQDPVGEVANKLLFQKIPFSDYTGHDVHVLSSIRKRCLDVVIERRTYFTRWETISTCCVF